jgi:hypothetical protein
MVEIQPVVQSIQQSLEEMHWQTFQHLVCSEIFLIESSKFTHLILTCSFEKLNSTVHGHCSLLVHVNLASPVPLTGDGIL